MQLERAHSWKKLVVQCLLLALPTIFFAFLLIYKLNSAYIILQHQWIYQGVYFMLGILISMLFYSWRFRFFSTILFLSLIYYIGYQILKKISFGEFDMFFFSVQYLIFIFIFSVGWLVGFGFSRWRFFTIFWVLFLLATEIIIISKIAIVTSLGILIAFSPVLLYSFYIIYTSELIRNLNEHQTTFGWYLSKRVGGFLVLTITVFIIIILFFKKEIINVEKDWKQMETNYQTDKSTSESLIKRNRDGTLSTASQMPLSGSLSKTKQLVFVAKLDNYFADGKTQNPLYFTSDYYTKFDTVTQVFQVDSLMPYNDLFKPNPSKISLFFTQTDSSVIYNSLASRNRKVVEADIYKVAMSPNDFLAPSTAFSVQPIPVPKEYATQYFAAYHTKMWVSDLNSAYFVYNPAGNNVLDEFQKTRINILKSDTNYQNINQDFITYYTQMPKGDSYKRIANLAKEITKGDTTNIEKILSIRNYFLSKDDFNQPLFQYTDNPGEPGLPNANKLDYFLFDNRKGYCAYFAGATLFLLRSLQIPSRIATGFLTVDRSSKNPGWYWFYEDQAHAWIQVFFPNYGWLDFDTTIPDENTQQAPQPDGTPPLGSQKVYFVADGIIDQIDSVKKEVRIKVEKVLFKDKKFTTKSNTYTLLNTAFAKISSDTGIINFNTLKLNLHITAASYDESINKLNFIKTSDTANYVITHIKQPVSIDEIKVIESNAKLQDKSNNSQSYLQTVNWFHLLFYGLLFVILILCIILMSPWLFWKYYQVRAKNSVHFKYRSLNYFLNQLGFLRQNQSPKAFAEIVDKKIGTSLTDFNQLYQKYKYSRQSLSSDEKAQINNLYFQINNKIKVEFPLKKRFWAFLNFNHFLHFILKNI